MLIKIKKINITIITMSAEKIESKPLLVNLSEISSFSFAFLTKIRPASLHYKQIPIRITCPSKG